MYTGSRLLPFYFDANGISSTQTELHRMTSVGPKGYRFALNNIDNITLSRDGGGCRVTSWVDEISRCYSRIQLLKQNLIFFHPYLDKTTISKRISRVFALELQNRIFFLHHSVPKIRVVPEFNVFMRK